MSDSSLFQIERWLGLNESPDGDVGLKPGEAAVMRNVRVTPEGHLKTRPGCITRVRLPGNSPVRGLWFGRVNGVPGLFAASGGHVYRMDETLSELTDLGTLTDSPTSFFGFSDHLYVLNGHEYKVWEGAGALRDAAGYAPVVTTATPPGGGGTVLEPANLLTDRRRQRFSPEGGETCYRLLEKELTAVESVTVDGNPVSFTADLRDGTVTLAAPPPEGIPNSVEILWRKAFDKPSPLLSCRFCETFGGATDTRVFLYGNGSNTLYHSGLDEFGMPCAHYFPANGFLQVDAANTPVTGLARHHDRLVVTKPDGVYFVAYDTLTDDLGNVNAAFVLRPLNKAVGHLAPGQVRLMRDNPVLVGDGALYEIVSTAVRDERNAREISGRVRHTLSGFAPADILTWDNEITSEYCCACHDRLLVHNYGNNTWYLYDNIAATALCGLSDALVFGTVDGRICLLDADARNDDGAPIATYWESGSMDFGANWRRKFSPRLWLVIKPDSGARVYVTMQSNGACHPAQHLVAAGLATFCHLDFRHVSFGTNRKPQSRRVKLKARRFVYYKLILRGDSESASSCATVLSAGIALRYGAESR